MDKLQTFLIYLLIIIGFFIVSEFLSGQLLSQMYVKLNGDIEEEFEYSGENLKLNVEVLDAKASKMNGIMKVRVTNTNDKPIDKAYLKMDLFAKKDIKALSRYLKITDLKPGESKDYTLKFNGRYVDTFKVAVKEDYPDKDYIFDIFGYEINTKNIFGMDLSKYINIEKIKTSGFSSVKGGISSFFNFVGVVGHRVVVTAKSVPWWGYVGALAIIGGIF